MQTILRLYLINPLVRDERNGSKTYVRSLELVDGFEETNEGIKIPGHNKSHLIPNHNIAGILEEEPLRP